MLLEIFMKGYVGLRFLLTLKIGHKRRKVENHCFRAQSLPPCCKTSGASALFGGLCNLTVK